MEMSQWDGMSFSPRTFGFVDMENVDDMGR